jgi:hypothetical protein
MNCRICFEDILNEEAYLILECNHIFHYNCLSEMCNSFCPLCKKENKDLLQNNGIFDKKKDDDDDDYIDDSFSDESFERQLVWTDRCHEKIDQLAANYDISFINTIKKLDIMFDINMIQRAALLYDALKIHNLTIRSDSVKCISYIQSGSGQINDIVMTMIEMDWFCNHTNYQQRMNNFYHHDRFEKSRLVKDKIIEDYVKNPEKYNVTPPNIESIDTVISKYKIIKENMDKIKNWNGNIDVNIYLSLDGNNSYDGEINNYLREFAKTHAKEKFTEYLYTNVTELINNKFENQMKYYKQLHKLLITQLHIEFDKHIEDYCKTCNFRYCDDCYKNYNDYCCKKIDESIETEIRKKYKKGNVKKFLQYERDTWSKHIRGTEIYKNMIYEIIEELLGDYADSYVSSKNIYYYDDINVTDISDFYENKIKQAINNNFINNTHNAVEQIINLYTAKLKNMNMNEKIQFIVKDKTIDDNKMQDVIRLIIIWFLKHDPKNIENDNAVSYLKKIDINKDKFISHLRKNKYFSEKLKLSQCTHTPSPQCSYNCCRKCCKKNDCSFHH